MSSFFLLFGEGGWMLTPQKKLKKEFLKRGKLCCFEKPKKRGMEKGAFLKRLVFFNVFLFFIFSLVGGRGGDVFFFSLSLSLPRSCPPGLWRFPFFALFNRGANPGFSFFKAFFFFTPRLQISSGGAFCLFFSFPFLFPTGAGGDGVFSSSFPPRAFFAPQPGGGGLFWSFPICPLFFFTAKKPVFFFLNKPSTPG